MMILKWVGCAQIDRVPGFGERATRLFGAVEALRETLLVLAVAGFVFFLNTWNLLGLHV
jgi:hypothetical protein